MSLTPEENEELVALEAAFEANGGRGVDDAERIDELRTKRDAVEITIVFEVDRNVEPGRLITYLTEMLEIPQSPEPVDEDTFSVIGVSAP